MKKIVFICGFLLILVGCLTAFWTSTPSKYIFESNAKLSAGKAAKAIKILEEGLKKYPNDHKITFSLAKAYLSLGETEQANNIILSKKSVWLLKDDKEFQNFLVDLSEANQRTNNTKHARYFGEKYLNHHNSAELSKRIIKNYILIGQVLPERSVEIWEKAYNISYALKQKELKESLKALLLPKYIEIVEGLKYDKKYDDALKVLSKAKVIGKNAEISYQEAVVYSHQGKIDLAEQKFEEALQLSPDNDNYKISYAHVLKDEALKTKDQTKKTAYFEKIKLLLASGSDDPRKINLLNKIINLNAKYKIINDDLKITTVGDFAYPLLTFKIKPVSDTLLKKYKIVFFDENKIQVDLYEAPITKNEINQVIQVTCKSPVNNATLVNAKLFVNDEFVKEYNNK